jgi:hypothetical protein
LKKYRGMTQSSGAERAKKEGMPISQVLYLGLMLRCRTSAQPSSPVRSFLKPLISGGFAASHRRSATPFAMQQKSAGTREKKISLANFSLSSTLLVRAEVVRFQKGEPNGLESTKNRRSAGRHGNQHVCVRRPQVTDSDISTFDAGGLPGVTRSR